MNIDNKLYNELYNIISSMPIFDTHEHMLAEQDRRKSNLDFSLFFMMYAGTDLKNAGMIEEDYALFQAKDVGLKEKWSYFSDYWGKIKNTSYSKIILEAVSDLYGYEDITEDNYLELSVKIKNTASLKWYDEVLHKSNVKHILNHLENIAQADIKDLDRPEFKPVINFDDVISLCCLEDIFEFEKKYDRKIYKLQDMLDTIDSIFEKKKN